ncbi:MAG: hypothetical protein KJ066_07375 [Acidobacteria bacterium]|nr:hypothetical protein [Acidobacteriota bacterium]
MLQELAAQTGAGAFVIGAMFFFIAVWIGVFVRVLRTSPADLESRARLPLDDPPARGPLPRDALRRAPVADEAPHVTARAAEDHDDPAQSRV